MKKLLMLAAIIILSFTGCDLDYGETGTGGGMIFFAEGNQYMECSGELGNTTWDAAVTTAKNYRGGGFDDWHLPTRNELDLMYKNLKKRFLGGFSNNRYWTAESFSNSSAYYQDFSNGNQDWNSKSDSYGVRAVRAYSKDTDTNNTTLKMNNQSLTEITDVIWQNVSFANNQYENSIKPSTNVTNTVQAGAGYIFFKRKTNPITARTNDMVVVEDGKNIEFTFTDNTVIVEVNNTDNNGTLGALQSTVVWWDDAEGDYLPYTQRTNASYSTTSPRYGQKCIALTSSGELGFNISLGKKAKLSFWHRATSVGTDLYQPILNINSVETKRWTNNNEWSFFECFIDAGNTTIQFRSTGANLFLDDILIYYTE